MVNKKFIHYSSHFDKRLTNNRTYLTLISISTPVVVSLNLSNLFWSIFVTLAVCYHISSTINYGLSYQKYLMTSQYDESFLNYELKKIEKKWKNKGS